MSLVSAAFATRGPVTMRRAAVAASLVLFVAVAIARASGPTVRLVYLVPTDRLAQPSHDRAIERAGRHLRIWFQQEMGDGTTFALHDPVVEVVALPHDSAWYNQDLTGAFEFWNRILGDAFAATGGSFFDPLNRWIYYVDVDPACGQGTGGTSGVALLPANDLRGLVGQPQVPTCPGDDPPEPPACRWIGGLGHELGHALERPHPPGCDEGTGGPECNEAIMYLGYLTYPDAVLLDADRTALAASGFFSAADVPAVLPSCTCGNGVLDPDELCDDGNLVDGDGCSSVCTPGCSAVPMTGCRLPTVSGGARLHLRDRTSDGGDRLEWNWLHGAATTIADFGTPNVAEGYGLCLFDAAGVPVMSLAIPSGASWKRKGSKKLRYGRPPGDPDGITRVDLAAGVGGRATVKMQGRGVRLPMPSLTTLGLPLRVQLQSESGRCWEARFSASGVKVGDAVNFRARSD